nr:hypothetical protein [Tanacetum cinerariifolium]
MNGKIHTVNVDKFRDMLQIFPKLPGQKFEDPLVEEEILSFIRELGHTGEIKDTQVYGALLPQHLTNQAMLEFEAYKTYHAYATGKRLKAIAKVPKSEKKKPPTQGLETLSKIAFSHTSGSGADEGTGVSPWVLYVPTYDFDDDHISWKLSDDEDNDDANDPSDDDDVIVKVMIKMMIMNRLRQTMMVMNFFITRCLLLMKNKERHDEKPDEEEEGVNVEEEKLDEDMTNEEEEVDELYNDVNINLKRRDTEMTDASLTNALFPTCSTVIRLQNLPTFGSLLKFEDRVKALEDDFLKFKETNLFVEPVSSIPGIINAYLANKMNEAVKTAI